MQQQSKFSVAQFLATLVDVSLECVILVLVAITPWAFGCDVPLFAYLLQIGLAGVLALWALQTLLLGLPESLSCPIIVSLLALLGLGVWQFIPLGSEVVDRISPATSQILQELLPETPEVLPGGESVPKHSWAAGRSLSLQPVTTYRIVLRWLGIVGLFIVVRTRVASPRSFRRLCIVVLVNGFALTLLGLFQFFSSPRDLVYWTYYVTGEAFGTMGRNPFASYLNLSIGLGLGLLLQGAFSNKKATTQHLSSEASWRYFLTDPLVMWVGAALGVMVSALVVSLSRGALLSFVVAGCVCFVLSRQASQKAAGRIHGLILLATGIAALVMWFGFGPVLNRITTLWPTNSVIDSRVELWRQTISSVRLAPLFGWGFGLFQVVEKRTRPPGSWLDHEVFWEHAHNDYFELLMEGGVLGLGLGLLCVGLAHRSAIRAFRDYLGQREAGLILGGIFALTTITVHSFLDFTLQIPAVAVLVAVIVAQLAGVGQEQQQSTLPQGIPNWLGWPMALVLGFSTMMVAILLGQQGLMQVQSERHRLASAYLENNPKLDQHQQKRTYYQAASQLFPPDPAAWIKLAFSYQSEYTERLAALQTNARTKAAFLQAGRLLGSGASPSPMVEMLGVLGSAPLHEQCLHSNNKAQVNQLRDTCLMPALRYYLQARDLAPHLETPQLGIASFINEFARAEPRSKYLTRAQQIVPADPQVWYLSGMDAQQNDNLDEAMRCWRKSLQCSPGYLKEILSQCRSLPSEIIVSKVFPDDPPLLMQAGELLRQVPGNREIPFYRRTLSLLGDRPLDLKELRIQATALIGIGESDRAVPILEQLLLRSPNQIDCRLELARLYFQKQKYQAAHRELILLRQQQPRLESAEELYHAVVKILAESGTK